MPSSTLDSSPRQPQNILILGSSYAGVSTAHNLLKSTLPSLPNPEAYKVILLSPSSSFLLRPACPLALIPTCPIPDSKLFTPVAPLFAHYPTGLFEFIHGTATTVSLEERTVTYTSVPTSDSTNTSKLNTVHEAGSIPSSTTTKTAASASEADQKSIPFHALIIATGSSTLSPLLGLTPSTGFSPTELRSSWRSFHTALPSARSILIAGAGPAGVEVAGELGYYFKHNPSSSSSSSSSSVAKPNQEQKEVSITLICSNADILPALRPAIARKADAYLADLGVTVLKNVKVESVSPANAGQGADSASLTAPAEVRMSNGETRSVDLYIPAMGTRANTGFLPGEMLRGEDERVRTQKGTMRVRMRVERKSRGVGIGDGQSGQQQQEEEEVTTERIYAVGDCSDFARGTIHSISAAVPALCANIKKDLLLHAEKEEEEAAVVEGKKKVRSDKGSKGGEEGDKIFKEDTRESQLVPIGRKKGVGAMMGWRMPRWVIWAIKGRDYWAWTVGLVTSGRM